MRRLGINWADVRGRVLAEGVRELLKEFVTQRE